MHLLLVVDVADHAWVHLRGLLRRIVQKCSVGELLRMLLREVLVRERGERGLVCIARQDVVYG